MSERMLKTRKAHECSSCHKQIPEKSVVLCGEGRGPAYELDGDRLTEYQVGIEYWRYYICSECLEEGKNG